MARYFYILLALAFGGIAKAKQATFVPRSHASKSALSVRGGAGSLDPTDTAKVGLLLAGTHGALSILSPSRTLKEYGAPSGPLLDIYAAGNGYTILCFCLQAYYLIVRDSGPNTAFTALVVPWLVSNIKCLWNEDPKTLGYPATGHWINAVMAAFSLFASLTDASYLDSVMKVVAVWTLANGLGLALVPETFGSAWGFETADTKDSMRTLGYLCTGSGIFQALISFTDTDPVKAFGYAWIPMLLKQIDSNFISKDSTNKFLSMFWLLVDAIVVGSCGFQKGLEHHDISSTL